MGGVVGLNLDLFEQNNIFGQPSVDGNPFVLYGVGDQQNATVVKVRNLGEYVIAVFEGAVVDFDGNRLLGRGRLQIEGGEDGALHALLDLCSCEGLGRYKLGWFVMGGLDTRDGRGWVLVGSLLGNVFPDHVVLLVVVGGGDAAVGGGDAGIGGDGLLL